MAKKSKRRKDAPFVPFGKRGNKDEPGLAARKRTQLAEARVRRRRILARTAAARAQIDELAADANMDSIAHLPVMEIVPLPPPPPPAAKTPQVSGGGYRIIQKEKRAKPLPPRAIKAPAPVASQFVARTPLPANPDRFDLQTNGIVPVKAKAKPVEPPTKPIATPKRPKSPSVMNKRCSVCDEPGHDIRRCTAPGADDARAELKARKIADRAAAMFRTAKAAESVAAPAP